MAVSFLTPLTNGCSAESLRGRSCPTSAEGPRTVCEFVALLVGSSEAIGWLPLPATGPCPLAPALTSCCWRLSDSLSIDTPFDPVCLWPPNFRVILGGSGSFAGSFAGILNFTFGWGGSCTTRLASASRRLKYDCDSSTKSHSGKRLNLPQVR